MRAEVQHHLLIAASEDPRVGQRRHSGTDLDGATTGVVEHAVLEGPAIGIPNPVGQRAVDNGGPKESEDHGGDDTTALSRGSDHQGCGDTAELHLVERVE